MIFFGNLYVKGLVSEQIVLISINLQLFFNMMILGCLVNLEHFWRHLFKKKLFATHILITSPPFFLEVLSSYVSLVVFNMFFLSGHCYLELLRPTDTALVAGSLLVESQSQSIRMIQKAKLGVGFSWITCLLGETITINQ